MSDQTEKANLADWKNSIRHFLSYSLLEIKVLRVEKLPNPIKYYVKILHLIYLYISNQKLDHLLWKKVAVHVVSLEDFSHALLIKTLVKYLEINFNRWVH